MTKTLCSQWRDTGSIPGWGTKILHTVLHGQKEDFTFAIIKMNEIQFLNNFYLVLMFWLFNILYMCKLVL